MTAILKFISTIFTNILAAVLIVGVVVVLLVLGLINAIANFIG